MVENMPQDVSSTHASAYMAVIVDYERFSAYMAKKVEGCEVALYDAVLY